MRLKHPLKRGVALVAAATILASSAAPAAFADHYYIGDGDLKIEQRGDGIYVNDKKDTDGNVVINGGSKPTDTSSAQSAEEETPLTQPADEDAVPVETETPAEEEVTYTDDAPAQEESPAEEHISETEEEAPVEEAEQMTDVPADEQPEKTEPTEEPTTEPTAEQEPAEMTETAQADLDAEAEAPAVEEEVTYETPAAEESVSASTVETVVKNTITIINNIKDKVLNVTFNGVKIDATGKDKAAVSVRGEGDVTLNLKGENEVQSDKNYAGIEKNANETATGSKGTLTITGSGSLKATGGTNGAGIGGSKNESTSNISITGGTITATGGDRGAGIGGGNAYFDGQDTAHSSADNITISGKDTVVSAATGGAVGAAGIGGGDCGNGTNITIKDGAHVTATGSVGTINGNYGGAGIGGGNYGSGENITITGEGTTVIATGGGRAAGIGGGDGSTMDSEGNHIGGNGTKITISNGATVTATGSSAGANGGAGIGGGTYGNGTEITIEGGSTTVVASSVRGAGIGGGNKGIGDVTITGGKVTASSSKWSAGIGGGANATGSSTVTINATTGDTTVIASTGNSVGAIGNADKPDLATITMDSLGEANKAIIQFIGNGKLYNTIHNRKYLGLASTTPTSEAHTWDEGTIIDKPTCTEPGSKLLHCSVEGCQGETTVEIPATGHTYGEWIIDKAATCTEAGLKHRDCVQGDDTQTEEIPATGHNWGEWEVITPATVGKSGLRTRVCKNDPTHVEAEVIPALDVTPSDDIPSDTSSTETTAPAEEHAAEEGLSPYLDVFNLLDTSVLANQELVQQKYDEASKTLTVDAALQVSTLTFNGLKLEELAKQGVEYIVFVTKGHTTTLSVQLLLEKYAATENSVYTLDHVGPFAQLRMDGKRIDDIQL